MGDLDITAEIDYVLKVTGQTKLAYIGHSQGINTNLRLSNIF